MCGFDGAQKVNFLRGEPIRTEVEERVRKFKNGNTVDKNEITGSKVED